MSSSELDTIRAVLKELLDKPGHPMICGESGADFRGSSIMNIKRLSFVLLLPLAITSSGVSQDAEKLPPGAKVVRLEVAPKSVELQHRFDYRQLLITGILQSGEQVDLTRLAKRTAPEKLVKISERGQVRP